MIYHVYANQSNSGDWLSAKGIHLLLAGFEIRDLLCDEPFVPGTLQALANATEEDLVVIGGGGLFMEYFKPFWAGFAPLSHRLRYCIWGVGVVDAKAEETVIDMGLLRPLVKRASLAVVRDDHTRTILAIPGLHEAVLCPSIVAVPGATTASAHGLLHAAALPTVGESVYREMVAVGQAFARRTRRVYRETSNRFSDGERGLAANLDLYLRSDVVLSSRLHGCIIGLAMGKPVVAVSGDRKVEAFMAMVNLQEWVVDAASIDRIAQLLDGAKAQPSAEAAMRASVVNNERVGDAVRALALRVTRSSPGGNRP